MPEPYFFTSFAYFYICRLYVTCTFLRLQISRHLHLTLGDCVFDTVFQLHSILLMTFRFQLFFCNNSKYTWVCLTLNLKKTSRRYLHNFRDLRKDNKDAINDILVQNLWNSDCTLGLYSADRKYHFLISVLLFNMNRNVPFTWRGKSKFRCPTYTKRPSKQQSVFLTLSFYAARKTKLW